jgi:hypothetical protein
MILSDRSKITKFFITTILLLCVHAAQAFITAERKERGCSSSLSHIASRICGDHKHLPSRWNSINPLASAKTAAESNKGEVLMKISFSLKEGHDDKTKAIDILRSYVASFPFSAVCKYLLILFSYAGVNKHFTNMGSILQIPKCQFNP